MANLKDLLDAKGFRIFELPVPNDELSGLSLWHSDYGPCILLNARDLKPRRNFTLAHELAHLLYSHGALACRIPPKLEEQAVGTERKADHFAVELLLPESTLRADFTKRGYSSTPSAEELRPMRSKWGVSLQALGYRLETLGLIARGHTDALVEPKPTYFRRPKTPKWERRLGKPFIETAFEAYQKNLVSIGKLAHSLGIPIRKAMEEVERRSK
jgi:Zn-dependent peptidase ImmA (M78 family)